MKKNYFFIFLFALTLAIPNRMHAQVNSDWQPIFLLVTGGNIMNGVEAFFQLNTCNGEDIIYVKFFNHNNKPVKLEWSDAVFTQELKWINRDKPGDKKSLIIPQNTEFKGECGNSLYPELLIKVKDFVADKKDFKRYSASRLTVIPVQ